MVIKQTGNVGIGTTNPLTQLELHGAANRNIGVFYTTGSAWGSDTYALQALNDAGNATAGNIGIQATNVLLQPISGNVGIGTTGPT